MRLPDLLLDATPSRPAPPPWFVALIDGLHHLLGWQQRSLGDRWLIGLLLIGLGVLLLPRLADLLPAVGLLLARLLESASRVARLLLALLREFIWVDPARRAARHARWPGQEEGEPALGLQLLRLLIDLLLLPIDWLASLGPQRLLRPDPGCEEKQQRRGAEAAPLLPRLGWVLGRHLNLDLFLSFLRLLQPRWWLPGFFWRSAVVRPDSYEPEFPIRRVLWLTLAADVREVLGRPESFAVVYGPRMRRATQPIEPLVDPSDDPSENGNFLLGMQDTPRYWRDISNMRLAFRREDAGRCGSLAERTATTALAQALQRSLAEERPVPKGGSRLRRIDLPVELVVPVAEALVNDYFGIPVPLACPGPHSNGDGAEAADGEVDPRHLWLETLFNHIFYDLPGERSLESCRRDAPRVRAALKAIIRRRRAQIEAGLAPDAQDVLSRCLRLQVAGTPGMDDETLRVNLTGFLVGAMTPLINATCQVVDVLLENPRLLARAQVAARAQAEVRDRGAAGAAAAGEEKEHQAELLACVMEALRFWPGDPVIYRWTPSDTVIGAGSRRCAVPRNTLVMAWNASAMFDPALLSDPWQLRTDRPPGVYMHWGHGQHSCAGAYLNMAVIPAMLAPLLRQQRLQRAPGAAGQPRKDGPDGITIRHFELLVRPAANGTGSRRVVPAGSDSSPDPD
ncbi:MAG: cytochrome P450 [Vulcanococcus sp.]